MEQLTNTVQTEFNLESYLKDAKNNLSNKLKVRKKSISLTQRDYELLQFILEMKFCTLGEVHHRFYKATPDGKLNGQTYAKKRLSQLVKEGLLKSTKAFDASKTLYYGTQKSFLLLIEIYPEKNICRYQTCIDGRTVVHDYYVLKMRLELEKNNQVEGWISDRSIRLNPGIYSKIDEGNTPDAIYSSPEGNFAFELELSVKSKSRYRDKIKKYVDYIRANANNQSIFKKVHYVVFSDATYKTLSEYTCLYKSYFKIEKASNYSLFNGVLK